MCASHSEPVGGVVHSGSAFATTHWSVVLAAQRAYSPEAEEALEELCRTYWRPLFAYVRGCGYRTEEAQDLTQEFFSRLIEKDFLARVRRDRGRFRSFLLACMKHFLHTEWAKGCATKRGGSVQFISWDDGFVETGIREDLHLALNPERLFARRWALTVLEAVDARLRAYYIDAGKKPLYDQLLIYLDGDAGRPAYADVARGLGMSTEAFGKAVQRMRRRYAVWLREEIARTVRDVSEIDAELRFLRQALAA